MTADDRSEETLDLLVVECIERCDREGAAALDSMCQQHPEFAQELREAVAPLLDVGVCSDATGITGSGVPLDTPPRTGAVGGYEIVREVGRGGMGIVYEARDPELNRSVALKMLHGVSGIVSEYRERFRREAAAAGSLQHENLVRVFGYGDADGCPWIAMEFVADAPLDRVLARLRGGAAGTLHEAIEQVLAAAPAPSEGQAITPASPGEVRRRIEIVLDVAAGLEHAHRHGIVHRDVKPSNILVRDDGRAVLTDFGLAIGDDLPSLTREGSFAGTPYYASPEQAGGRMQEVDGQSDVFSLGVTLYELLTLHRPFDGPTSRDVLTAIEKQEPRDPVRIAPNLAEDLAAITLKALAKERRERYADVGEFAADLRAFLELRPVSARRATATQRLRRWARREPLRAAFAAVVLVALLVISGVVGFAISQQPLVEAAERQQKIDAAARHTARGWGLLRMRDDAGAAQAFAAALENVPGKREAIVGQVILALEPHDGGPALRVLQPHLDAAPDDQAWLRLQQLCLRQSFLKAEANALDARIEPPQRPLEYFLASIDQLISVEGREGIKKEKAVQESYRKSLAYLNAAIATSPHPVPAYYFHLGSLVVPNLDDPELARNVAQAVITQWPEDPYAWRVAADALEEFDPKKALEHYQKAAELAPDEPRHRVRIAERKYKDGDQAAAEKELRACLDAGLKDDDVLQATLAKIHRDREEWSEAIEHAEQAVILGASMNTSTWGRHMTMLLNILAKAGEHEEAFERAEKALDENKVITDFHVILINLYMSRRRMDDAERIAEALVERAPEHHMSWFHAGRVYFTMGQRKKTIEYFEKVCAMKPENVEASTNLAMVYLQSNQLDKALEFARKSCVASEYAVPIPVLMLARILAKRNELVAAEHYYLLVLDLETLSKPRNPGLRKNVERELEALRARK